MKKKVVRLSESQLVEVLKRVISEQVSNQEITIKQLKKDRYDVPVGSLPLDKYDNQHLFFTDIIGLGETDSGAQLQYTQNLRLNKINILKINRPNTEGLTVKKTLENGNIEYRFIRISS